MGALEIIFLPAYERIIIIIARPDHAGAPNAYEKVYFPMRYAPICASERKKQ
jgi:hypothetical protein